jgi:hypothetical protein
MMEQCAVCEATVPDSAAHCSTCGFPMEISDLAARLILELPEPDVPTGPHRSGADATPSSRNPERTGSAGGRDPQKEVVSRIARDVSHAVSLLQDLGGDGADIANELAQAAFTEAEGRIGEVLVLLRDAQGRVSIRLKEQFDSRLKQLDQRQTAMVTSGVSVDLIPELERIRTDVRAGRRESALQRIDLIDRNLARMESDWRGLQGLLRQIEGLRESGRLLELDVTESDDSLRQVRVILAQPSLDVGALDHAAELAAEAVMRLHDSIPIALEESLDRMSMQVGTWPLSFDGRRRALELERDTRKLLKSNRLVEATQRASELRQLINRTGVPPAPVAETVPSIPDPEPPPSVAPTLERIPARKVERIERPPPPTTQPTGPPPSTVSPLRSAPPAPARVAAAKASHADNVRTLVAQARELAARIQRLPGGTELTRAAAVEIRNATDLLRERKMDEAGKVLSELKERLDRAFMEPKE